MKILIVNDDGYQAEGLKLLINATKKYGEVVVYSPLKCESAQSQKITVHRSIKTEVINNITVVHGSTADCVRLGVFDHPDIDIVLSGVNEGLNLGQDIYYSSTIAGVIQAGLFGYRGIAFSCDKNYSDVIPQLDEVLNELLLNNSKYEALLNVNFPVASFSSYKGIKFTKCSNRHYENDYKVINGEYFESDVLVEDYSDDSDSGEVNKGYVSISNLILERIK